MMEAFKVIQASRQNDRNPFREMLQKMGVFGGPKMQDMVGAPQQQQGRNPGMTPGPSGGQELQRLVQMLMAKGMPKEQAMQQAQKLMQQGQQQPPIG